MTKAVRFTQEQLFKFIELYRDREVLWNYKNRYYRLNSKREYAIQEIANEMNINGFGLAEILKKIRSIRNTYIQEKNKIKKSIKSGAIPDEVYKPQLSWFKLADSFLDNVVGRERRGETSNMIMPRTLIYDVKEEQEYEIKEEMQEQEDEWQIQPQMRYMDIESSQLIQTAEENSTNIYEVSAQGSKASISTSTTSKKACLFCNQTVKKVGNRSQRTSHCSSKEIVNVTRERAELGGKGNLYDDQDEYTQPLEDSGHEPSTSQGIFKSTRSSSKRLNNQSLSATKYPGKRKCKFADKFKEFKLRKMEAEIKAIESQTKMYEEIREYYAVKKEILETNNTQT